MNDAIIIRHVFIDGGMSSLLDATTEITQEYCRKYNIDLVEKVDTTFEGITGHWRKVELLKEYLPQYKYLMWLDADAFISRDDVDIRDACKRMSAVKFYYRDRKPIYNVGVLYMENSPEVISFINRWLTQPLKNEQVVFNEIAGEFVIELLSTWNYTIDRHFNNDNPIVKGFHSIRGLEEKLSAINKALKK